LGKYRKQDRTSKQNVSNPHLQHLPLSWHAMLTILGLRCNERPELPGNLVELAPSVLLLPPGAKAHHTRCILVPSQFPNCLQRAKHMALVTQFDYKHSVSRNEIPRQQAHAHTLFQYMRRRSAKHRINTANLGLGAT